MTGTSVERAAEWMHKGVWAALVRWFRVPQEPPTLPVGPRDTATSFRPAPEYFRYLKFWFWLLLIPVDVAIVAVWIVVFVYEPAIAMALAIPMLIIAVVPDIIAYVAIHLRYETMWYVMTDRSLRIRRGIWIIKETTITFENVQNIKVSQGPVQRAFKIADVVVETAGGSAGPNGTTVANVGVIEGVADGQRIRDAIMSRLRQSQSAGLGDEEAGEGAVGTPGWTRDHVEVLREICEEIRLAKA